MAEELKAAFPYPPYDIQQQFMINVVDTLEKKQIGLFESPTGTGKTLSVICSTLYWLEVERERQAKAAAEAAQTDCVEGLPDWLAAASTAQTLPPAAQQKPQKTKKSAHKSKAALLDDEGNDLSEFLPDTSSKQGLRDTTSPGSKRAAPDAGSYSSSSSEDEAADTAKDADTDVAAAAEERRQPQVIFCSRTHSQLSQFVGELHRTRFGSSVLLVAVASRKALCVNDEVRQLSELSQVNERCLDLQRSKASSSSSKKKASLQGAANSSVVGFLGASRPRQQQQQQRRQRKSAGCPYLSVEGGASAWDDFKSTVLRSPMDVEELASLGRKQKICPYYGSRRAVPSADVVLAPYSAVLMPDARDSLGIQLQDSVLVFDEAHNLLDAINGAHSTTVTSWQLLSVQRSLTAYYDRFKGVLNPLNADNIQRLLLIASALHKCLQHQQQTPQERQQQQQHAGAAVQSSSSSGGRVTTVNDLLFDLGLDTFNMFELAHWVRDNKMAFKVSGYTAAAVAKAGGSIQLQQHPQPGGKSTAPTQPADDDTNQQPQQQQQQQSLGHLSAKDGVSAIHSFISFILCLTHADADGRIIVEPATMQPPTAAAGDSSSRPEQASKGGQLRYVLLNAAGHFGKLLASARSVLLVSGTLAPLHGLQAQLFPDVAPERVRHFECGHVVPKEQLIAVSIGRGPSGRALNLKHGGRGDAAVMAELGQLLVNLCGVVPEGLVVFVPSFSYLEQLSQAWRASGLWDRLSQRKQVFSEPRAATDVEAVLAAYAAAISGEPAAGSSATGPQGNAAGGIAAPAQPTPAGNSSGTAAAAAVAGAAGAASAGAGSQGKGSSRGALMLCVVGAKLSEGINFGDGLGRCVVVVGLPYPNSTDVELQARMQYLDRLAAHAASGTASAAAVGAGHPTGPQHSSQHQATGDPQGQQQQEQPAEPPARRSVFQVLNQGRPWAVSPAATQQPMQQPVSAAGKAATSQGVAGQQPQQPEHVTNTAAIDNAGPDKAPAPDSSSQAAAAGATTNTGSSSSSSKVITGREYYEDLCFKAVNQCVGRVVRHKGDYAAVVLLDTRWVAGPAEWAAVSSSSSNSGQGGSGSRRTVPVQKLPGWLQRSYVPTSGDFGPALKELVGFFRRQRPPA